MKLNLSTAIAIISLGIITPACWPIISENKILSDRYEPIRDSLSNTEFIGEWEAIEFTYGVLDKLNYVISDSLDLVFSQDGSFVFNNYPQGLYILNKFPKQKNFSIESGNWEITRSYQFPDEYELNMRFRKSELFEKGFSLNFKLYNKDHVLTILTYMDDPDLARIIAFTKK
jgi:hypothetical protein